MRKLTRPWIDIMAVGYKRPGTAVRVPGMLLGFFFSCLSHAGPLTPNAMAIGVPEPTFGVHDSHERYAGVSGYLDAGNGPYTHYVDNTVDHCDNSGPGTADIPLCNLPTSVPAGSVIEVHGGPYTDHETATGGLEVTLNGTQSQPVFLRGVAATPTANPLFRSTDFTLLGAYFVVENMIFDATRLLVGGDEPVIFGAVRRCEIKDQPVSNAVHLFGRDLVFVNNHVHHSYGDDRHGVKVSSQSKRIWILNNVIHHHSGDGIQFCHNCTSAPPEYVYIANNHIFSNRENGVDLKYGKYIVVSQNRINAHIKAPRNQYWCFDDESFCGTFSSGSDGSSIVIGSDGKPNDVLVLFNTIYDSNNGIRVEEVDGAVIVGNQTYNIDSAGLVLEKSGESVHYVNNTLHGMPTGVKQKSDARFDINVSNNIFSHIVQPLRIVEQNLADTMRLNNNLFWNDGADFALRWVSDRTLHSSADFNELPGRAKHGNRVANPRFVNQSGPVFNLGSQSDAIDNANDDLVQLDVAYRDKFRHDRSILRDFNGFDRTNCLIDIGALEYSCGERGGTEPPSEPPRGGDGEPPSVPPEVIEAQRSYKPKLDLKFDASFDKEISIRLPEAVEVTQGQSGNGWLSVELARGAELMKCFYEGSGSDKKTKPPCSQDNGTSYHFRFCMDSEAKKYKSCSKRPDRSKCEEFYNSVSSNDLLSIDAIELSILASDSCGITTVEMTL